MGTYEEYMEVVEKLRGCAVTVGSDYGWHTIELNPVECAAILTHISDIEAVGA